MLSNTVGAVLDPIVSLRRRVRVRPGKTVRVVFSTLVAPSRSEVLDLAEKYHDVTTFERVATLAWTQAQVQLHHLGIAPDEAHLFQTLGGSILYVDRALRAPAEVLARRVGECVGALGAGDLGRPARSCSWRSTTPTTSASCGSCCARTSTGG